MSEKLYKSQFTLIALVLTVCAFILLSIGIATPLWHRSTNGSRSLNYGIFYLCTSDGSTNECGDHGIDSDWHKIVQSLEIIGIFLLFLCVIVILLNMFLTSGLLIIYSIVAAALLITGLCILIGAIIYGSQVNGSELHFSFAVSILTAFLTVAAAVFLLISIKIQEKYYHQTKHLRRDSVAKDFGRNYLKTESVSCRSNKISPYTKGNRAKKQSRGRCTSCCLNVCYHRNHNHASIVNEEYHKTRDTSNISVYTNDHHIQNEIYNVEIHSYNERGTHAYQNTQETTNNTQRITENDPKTTNNIETQTNEKIPLSKKYTTESLFRDNVPFCPCILLHGYVEEWRRRSLQNECTCGCCDLGDVKYPLTSHTMSAVKLETAKQNAKISRTKTRKTLKTNVTESVHHNNDKGIERYGDKTLNDTSRRNEMESNTKQLNNYTRHTPEHRLVTSEKASQREASVSKHKPNSWSTCTRDQEASYASKASEKVQEAQDVKATVQTRRRLSSNDDSNESSKAHNTYNSKSAVINESCSDSFDSFIYDDVNTQNSFLDSPINTDSPDYKGTEISQKQEGNKKTSIYSRHSTNDDTSPKTKNEIAKDDTLDECNEDMKIFRHRKAVVHTPKIMHSNDDVVYLAEQQSFYSPSDETGGKDDQQNEREDDTTLDPQGLQDIDHKQQSNKEFETNFHQKPKESPEKIPQNPGNAKRPKRTKSIKWTPGKPWRSIF